MVNETRKILEQKGELRTSQLKNTLQEYIIKIYQIEKHSLQLIDGHLKSRLEKLKQIDSEISNLENQDVNDLAFIEKKLFSEFGHKKVFEDFKIQLNLPDLRSKNTSDFVRIHPGINPNDIEVFAKPLEPFDDILKVIFNTF